MSDTQGEQDTSHNEFGKRHLSDRSEHTGESPDAKKQFIRARGRFEMPSDEAPSVDWYKAIFSAFDVLYKQCDELKESLSFHIKEVEDCQGQITQANAKISGLELQVNNLEDENKRLKAQSSLQSEKLLKTEIKLREYNLVFDGIPETYGEDSHLLHKKFVDVLNHMVVITTAAHMCQ